MIQMDEQFLQTPNLPSASVSCVILSGCKPAVVQALRQRGIRTITLRPLAIVKGAEASHADMGFCDIGQGSLFAAAQMDKETLRQLEEEGASLTLTAAPVTAQFPWLNICILGSRVICHPPAVDPALLSLLQRSGYEIIPTRQRYARCSTAIVSHHAVITADPSIASACRTHQIDTLQIRPGGIELDGYEYGFIGGCCGLLSPEELAFSGDLSLHPDGSLIRSFLSGHGVRPICLTEEPLYDVGGILPIKLVKSSSNNQ